MKRSIAYLLSISAFAAIVPGVSFAQQPNNNGNNNSPNSSSQLDRIAAHELDPTAPNQESTQVPESSTQFALKALQRTEGTTAGIEVVKPDAKDTKEMVSSTPSSNWFSEPAVYSDYQYEHVQDTLAAPLGLDGDKHSGTVGFDFVSLWKTVIGFNFHLHKRRSER